MSKLLSLFVGTLLLVLSGCEEPVDLATLQVKDQIVIDSRLQSGVTPQITLNLYDGFGDRKNDLTDVLASSVIELQIVGTDTTFLLDTLPLAASIHVGARSFRVPDYKVRPGARYKLKVTTPGFPSLSSVTLVPQGAVVDALDSQTFQDLRATIDTIEEALVAFDLADVPGVDNFYHVLVRVSETGALNVQDGGVPAIETRVPLVRDLSGQIDAAKQGVLFTDADFADRTTRVVATVPVSLLTDYASPVAAIEVRTVSREYYRYYSQQFSTGNNVLPGTIAGAYDNVSGGAGLFGAFSSSPGAPSIKLK